jgi:hypothetical protein
MCHFITATIPKNAHIKTIAAIFDAHKLRFHEISNRHVAAHIGPGEMQILTTRGHCDCGTVLGSLNRPDKSEETPLDHELTKLRKKGWSEAKIQRWADERERTKEKRTREDAVRAETGTPLADQWINFIEAALKSGQTPRIGLLLHEYSGGIESERIKVLHKGKIKMANLTPDLLIGMKEDVLYEFSI